MTKSSNGKTTRVWSALWILTVIVVGAYFAITGFRAHDTRQGIFAIVFFGGIIIVDRIVMAWRNRLVRRKSG